MCYASLARQFILLVGLDRPVTFFAAVLKHARRLSHQLRKQLGPAANDSARLPQGKEEGENWTNKNDAKSSERENQSKKWPATGAERGKRSRDSWGQQDGSKCSEKWEGLLGNMFTNTPGS